MKLKLREKILIPVVLTIALGMAAGFLYTYLASTNAIEEGVRKSLIREVRNTADLMDKWLEARLTDLATWGLAPVFKEALTEGGYYGERARQGANDLLETLEKGYPYYDFIFVADAQGYLISSSHRSDPKKYRINDREYFQGAMMGKHTISDVIVSRESGERVFVVAVPLVKEDRIAGVLAGAVNVRDFSAYLIHGFKLGQKGFAYIAEQTGRVISSSDPALDASFIDTNEFGREIISTAKGSLVFRHQGQQFLAAFDTLGQKNWVYVVIQSLDEAFASARRIGWYTLAAGLVLLIIVGVVVTDIFRKMVYQRFDRMLDAIGQVERGRLDVRIQDRNETDEIGELSQAFNHMTARLESTLESLHHEIKVRRQTEKALAHNRDTLEIRVADRTSELLALRNYLSDIINSMPSIIVGVSRDMRISQWNLKAEEVTGVPAKEAKATFFHEQFPHLTSLVPAMAQAMEDQQVFYRPKVRRAAGFEDITVYPLVARGMSGAVIRIDDVTERVKLDEIMVQSEKMMSVGGLAAGMAHEINNPLAGMIQNVQVLGNRMKTGLAKNREAALELGLDPDLIQQYMEKRGMFRLIDNTVAAGARAAQIVDNMLSFSRKEKRAEERVVLSDLMDKTLDLARSDFSLKAKFDFKHITIFRHYPAKEVAVMGHASMLQQVFFNILKNGAQAMAGAESGVPPCFEIYIYALEDKAVVEIQDNGPGMDKETCRRIFEPFFSTKGVGKGTGLGLSVSYFIIAENHGGTIEAASEPGKGASFTIRLPLSGSRS